MASEGAYLGSFYRNRFKGCSDGKFLAGTYIAKGLPRALRGAAHGLFFGVHGGLVQ